MLQRASMVGEGVKQWVLVNISEWHPSPDCFSFLLSLLPPHEHPAIIRFMKIEDRKRALVSRLLQYSMVHEVLDIPFDEIKINRTPQGKPYLENAIGSSVYPNFNFNVSHSGDYVGISSDPACPIGMDIVSINIPICEGAVEFIANFRSYFTTSEWREIINAGTELEVLDAFNRSWCLKEAYVKAIGVGLDYKLDRLAFHQEACDRIILHIDGVESREWRFQLFHLDSKHWVAIARGPPCSAQGRTLQQEIFQEKDYNCCLLQTSEGFVLRGVEELLPISHRESYILLCKNSRASKLGGKS